MKKLMQSLGAGVRKSWRLLSHDIWQPLAMSPVEAVAELRSGDALSPQAVARLQAELADRLPAHYVRAFDNQPLRAGDPRFVGRAEVVEQLQAALNEWRDGRASLTAITGPHGCGLTSVLNQVRGLVAVGEQVRYLSLAERPDSVADALRLFSGIFRLETPPATVTDIVAAINALPPTLLLVDDGHMLLSRSPGNQAAVQAIGAILVATQHRHGWIIACPKQAWRRLDFIYEVERFFSRVIKLDYFDATELTDIVGRRFYGLGLRWQPDVEVEPEEWLARRVKQLQELSGGLPQMAFFFLLNASAVEGDSVSLAPFSALDTSVLKNCNEEELFSLAEIFVHGVMSHIEHETLFRISHDQSLLRLERLRRLGILNLVPCNGHYTSNSYYLSPILAQATVAHLVNSNRLY